MPADRSQLKEFLGNFPVDKVQLPKQDDRPAVMLSERIIAAHRPHVCVEHAGMCDVFKRHPQEKSVV